MSTERRPASPAYSSYDSDEEDNLPYPSELSRADFLTPGFDPEEYLSTLHDRHQTLEDLRSDLRQRSQLLDKELGELVNGEFEAFLTLGRDLHGGEESVEGVRVGVLGFEREVEGVRRGIEERLVEFTALLDEKKEVRGQIQTGRALLDISSRVQELESALGVRENGNGAEETEEENEDDQEDDYDSDDSDDDAALQSVPLPRLRNRTREYVLLQRSVDRHGANQPFLRDLRPRIDELRKVLLLDLASGLRRSRHLNAHGMVLKIIKLYESLGAECESIKILKSG